MPLPPDLFHETVHFLRPHCEREDQRTVLLVPLEAVLPQTYSQIQWEGDPQAFWPKGRVRVTRGHLSKIELRLIES
jgi:hypothetical protein